jgi:hypothetical protein
VVVAERTEPMPTDMPLTVTADKTFAEVPEPTVVIVPGGGPPTIKAMGNQALRDYLRRVADTAPVVGSVCTGAMILAAAGLLEGRNATTHWSHHRLLERLGARYVPERWVEDGRIITSAGVSAGIDMAWPWSPASPTSRPPAWSSSGSSTIPTRPSAGSPGTRSPGHGRAAGRPVGPDPAGRPARAPGQAERLIS